MAISFKGAHFPQDIILMGVRWYVAYPLSYRHVEELMQERGVPVDHATIQRWVVKYSPLLEAAFHRRKRSVWLIWRMDETYLNDHQLKAGGLKPRAKRPSGGLKPPIRKSRSKARGIISIAPWIRRGRPLTFS